MAAVEAGQSHAAFRLFRRESGHEYDLQRYRRGPSVGAWFCFGGVRLPALQVAKLLGTLIAGSLPFSAMGLAIGYFAGPNSAPPTINLIYLPMSFCSGLWVPFVFLPKLVRQIALALPPYHLSQLPSESLARDVTNPPQPTGSPVGFHADLSGSGPHRVPARSREVIRVGQSHKTVRHYAESGGKE